eukprot:450755-Pelagomonas_calceolata.AAC.9
MLSLKLVAVKVPIACSKQPFRVCGERVQSECAPHLEVRADDTEEVIRHRLQNIVTLRHMGGRPTQAAGAKTGVRRLLEVLHMHSIMHKDCAQACAAAMRMCGGRLCRGFYYALGPLSLANSENGVGSSLHLQSGRQIWGVTCEH